MLWGVLLYFGVKIDICKNDIILNNFSTFHFTKLIFFFRVKKNRRNQRIRNTGITSKEYIYSQPDNTQEAVTENIQREPDNNIDQLEEEYSKLHSADKMEFNKTLDDDYAMTEESSEYDVLRSKRKNQEVSVDANIYDRANNSVSGIYDTTLQTPDNNTYNL